MTFRGTQDHEAIAEQHVATPWGDAHSRVAASKRLKYFQILSMSFQDTYAYHTVQASASAWECPKMNALEFSEATLILGSLKVSLF